MAVYLLITQRTKQFNPEHIPGHYEHLNRLKEAGKLKMFGPFGDQTGGAYLIEASSMEEAEAVGREDPLIRNGSSTVTVKEWLLR